MILKLKNTKFHQYNSSILIHDIDINEIVVSNKFTFAKQDFKYFICHKNNKIHLYTYSFQKWVYIKDTLIRLNVCILW